MVKKNTIRDGRNLSLNKFLKKIILVLSVLFTLLSLSSCNVEFITTKTQNESFDAYLKDNGMEFAKKDTDLDDG